MLNVKENINNYYKFYDRQNFFNFIEQIKNHEVFQKIWIDHYNNQEKIEIKNKMIAIINNQLSMEQINIDEIKFLFIELLKNHCDAESFYNFLKKDNGIIEQNIISILNDFIHFKNVVVNFDVLEKLIEIFPSITEIFNSKKNFEELVQKNVRNTHKLLELIKKSDINLVIENGIYLINYIQENNIDFNTINSWYQYLIQNIDQYNLNQIYLLGSVLPSELTDQYFELLLEKDVFHHLEFTIDNGVTNFITNREFQRKFLQHYSKKISPNLKKIIIATQIDLLFQYILDNYEKYSDKEINDIFTMMNKYASFTMNTKLFDLNLFGIEPINAMKKISLTKDVTYLWQMDAYYKNFTPILERYMMNQLQNEDNIKLLNRIESPLTNEYLSVMNNKNPEVRKKLYTIFYDYYKKRLRLENNDYDQYIHQLFKQFVGGKHIYAISQIKSSIEMIAFLKMHYWQLDLTKLTEEQIKNINVKHIFKLERMICKFYQNLNDEQIAQYHLFLVKCYLIFGFDKAKIVLESIDKINELEHLFDTVDTRNIKYDETGKLLLNEKFIRMYLDIFKRKNKNSDAYNLFPDIYNDYDNLIKNLQKDSRTLPTIIKNYKNKKLKFYNLPFNYYQLMNQMIYISDNDIVKQNLKWYEIMKLRYISNIPKVSGKLNEYRYEMLDLDDPLTITVGKRTNCCFLLDGSASTSLKHAMTKDNGRVFVIFDGDEVIAQSWVWRDGNIVCFDNVETTLNNQEISDCYIEAIQKIVMESKQKENFNEQIKMVTIGMNNDDLNYTLTKQYPRIISENFLTQFSPVFNEDNENNDIYCDAKTKQCVIYQEPNFEIEDNNHLLNPIFLDQRPSIEKKDIESSTDLFDIKLLLNSINYDLKLALITDEELSKGKTVYYNKDWYLIINKDGSYLSNIYSIDPRAHAEYRKILETIGLEKETVLVKNKRQNKIQRRK